jgi:glucan-binding YG repeat protein
MEEPEVPLEQVQEHIEHHAHHEPDSFIPKVALSTAIIAAFAAITSLLAGDHANEAMVSQIQASDQWAYFQAKGIKAGVLSTKIALIESMDKKASPKDEEKLAEYAREQAEISKEANALQHEAREHLAKHKKLASGVTLLQIAIAVGAISALTKRKAFWGVSLVFALGGVIFLVLGVILTVPTTG